MAALGYGTKTNLVYIVVKVRVVGTDNQAALVRDGEAGYLIILAHGRFGVLAATLKGWTLLHLLDTTIGKLVLVSPCIGRAPLLLNGR